MGWPLALVLVALITAGTFGVAHVFEIAVEKLGGLSSVPAATGIALLVALVLLTHKDLLRVVEDVIGRDRKRRSPRKSKATNPPDGAGHSKTAA